MNSDWLTLTNPLRQKTEWSGGIRITHDVVFNDVVAEQQE
jgi:hypothetical protein